MLKTKLLCDNLLFQYYNAEQEAIGYYVRLPSDRMTFRLKHFDFPGFKTSERTGGVDIKGNK